ncbi:MAG: DUF1015 domain-containing protein [Chloroflexi bacterium HGW-Chloroflexi-10]|nr:MAG: DUF1015 domain-containing protein [Chloroflexi bacterium HGW-Chloroflexi-10]
MKTKNSIGVQIPKILLPNRELDYQKWAVIACDQYTSEPEYWKEVEDFVGDSPSTLRMVLPEVYLETEKEHRLIIETQKTMCDYIQKGLLFEYEGFILVERTVAGKTRHGLIMALDLEQYDYNKGSQTLIRATEGTIIDRLPPRMRIRENAIIEFPHILVLIDDPQETVIEPVLAVTHLLKKLYDIELMQKSGHLCGYGVNQSEIQDQILISLGKLASPEHFQSKYGVNEQYGVLLFAMGDGNHSLATAKAIWEKNKKIVGMDHPSRYALVEIENIHSKGLEFEPIHRVLFQISENPIIAMQTFWKENFSIEKVLDEKTMVKTVDSNESVHQKFGFIQEDGIYVVTIENPATNLAVGTLQQFLDKWVKNGVVEKIDYVHGREVTCKLGSKPGNCGFYLPAMPKNELFKTVILDGALPRKTFSMGEAYEKRFYLEGRKITI